MFSDQWRVTSDKMIHLLRQPATHQQIREMLEVHGSYIKVAVDIERRILAGGGEFHADCESVLLEEGSQKEHVWGADWIPADQAVRCSALINLRPRVNPSMEIQSPPIRQQVDAITRTLLQQ